MNTLNDELNELNDDDNWNETYDLEHQIDCLEDDLEHAKSQLDNQRMYNAELLRVRKLQANKIKELETEILKLKGD